MVLTSPTTITFEPLLWAASRSARPPMRPRSITMGYAPARAATCSSGTRPRAPDTRPPRNPGEFGRDLFDAPAGGVELVLCLGVAWLAPRAQAEQLLPGLGLLPKSPATRERAELAAAKALKGGLVGRPEPDH